MAAGVKSTKHYFEYYSNSTDETSFSKAISKPVLVLQNDGSGNITLINSVDSFRINVTETENMDSKYEQFTTILDILKYIRENQ